MGDCENILKEKYKISQDLSLIILKLDIFIPEYSIPLVQYEVFNPITLESLNLNYCNQTFINILFPALINEKELYKYDPNNSFYNDKCYSYSTDNGIDLSINERKNEYNKNNLAICEKNCVFMGFKNGTKMANCKCKIKEIFETISFIYNNKEILLNKFTNIKNTINIDCIFCYKALFCSEGIKKNIGSYVLIGIIVNNVLWIAIFYNKEYEIFFKYIKNILNLAAIHKKNNNNNLDINNRITLNNNDDNVNNANVNKIKNIKKKNNKDKIISINLKQKENNSPMKRKNKNYRNKALDKQKNKITFLSLKNSSLIKLDKRQRINFSILGNNVYPSKSKNILSDKEMNELSYNDALIYDKRSFFECYISLLKTKHLFMFAFFAKNDYNSKNIKISLFFFSFSVIYFINSLFFQEKTMHKIFEDNGIFNLVFQLPQILYSTIISMAIIQLAKFLSLSQNNIIQYKRSNNANKANKNKIIKNIQLKLTLFFMISNMFLVFFWYYISCFGAIYKNNQLHLIKDTLISFGLSLIYPFIINLVPGILRITSLKHENESLFKISKIFQLL